MTEHNPQTLEAQIEQLNQRISELESERDYLAIESKLAVEDAELARSFSKKNYTQVIDELFHKPAKRLSTQVRWLLLINCLAILALVGSILYPQLLPQLKGPTEDKFSELHRKLDQLAINQTQQPVSNSAEHALLEEALGDEKTPEALLEETTVEATESTDSESESVATSFTSLEAIEQEALAEKAANDETASLPVLNEKDVTINQQSQAISEYVQIASTKTGFPADYGENKTSLAQLYLIIMQNASNDNIYYESYLKALESLDIADTIKPKTVDDLVRLDRDFLQAAFGAYLITRNKQTNKWRYREEDRGFGSYYNPSIGYDLGAWKIVNPSKDYTRLPEIYSLNVKRIAQQLAFNQQIEALRLPQTIYYLSYDNEAKDQAVRKLFGVDDQQKQGDKLALPTTHAPLSLSTNAVVQLQTRLADEGFMEHSVINGIAGPKTKGALKAYQQTKGLAQTGKIDLALLKSLGITPTFYDLSY